MVMKRCWDPITRDRSIRRFSALWVVFLFSVAAAGAQPLVSLTRNYLKKPAKASRRALLAYARLHAAQPGGALALLVVGAGEIQKENYQDAIKHLRAAKAKLPLIADYPAYYLAQALYGAGKYRSAITELQGPAYGSPPSPLRSQAILLAARIYLDSGAPGEGAKLLRGYLPATPQPAGLALLAQCLERAGKLAAAAAAYQRIYYDYPVTGSAKQAARELRRLKKKLRGRYPPATAQMMFRRVEKLMRAHRHRTARKELQRMTRTLGGADRDRARVWLGKARYLRRQDRVAYRWLKSLRVASPEADAERLYYLLESARGLGRTTEISSVLRTLAKKYPASKWRLRALVAAGNYYLLENRWQRYVPIYRTCAAAFPNEARADYCDWKVAWSYYIRRLPVAGDLLRRHLERFPASDKSSAAFYFLGRLSEQSGNAPAARTYYEELETEYPNFYYAGLARRRLASSAVQRAAASTTVKAFLSGIKFPRRRHRKDFKPTAATRRRLERARLLFSAGLDDWGERELRFGARHDGQGPILAMELAISARRRGAFGRSIRYIKSLAPGYLSMPLEAAPASFWRLAFPLPYRATIEKYARKRDLNFYFLAALIRQESEFDTRAVSRAHARGLTQILPATGRQLSRKLRIRGYRTSWLYRPGVNLDLGTYYLRSLIDDLDGHTVAALASYNAGKSRAKLWLGWAQYRESAEFVETIPFTETRTYVQTVLRNADVYRRLYGSTARMARMAK